MATKKSSANGGSELVPPTLLLILDGFGLAPFTNPGNAVTPQVAPNIFEYLSKYPSTSLQAHGEYVGLFPGQEGNSEAGHFNIGAGRLVEQDLVHISRAITNGTFFKNEAFKQALFHVKKYESAVHIMGLLTDDESAHARPEHLYALLDYFRRNHQKEVYLHLFTDGRDSSPHAAVEFLQDLRKHLKNGEKIATVMGRFYGMDRNKIWERTAAAYDAITSGRAVYTAKSAEEAVASGYNRGETDEYISPTIIVEGKKPLATIRDNDAIYFFNARSDRARQITKAFVQKDFNKKNPGSFKRKKWPKHTRFVAMTDFGPDLPGIFTAFPSPDMPNCLAKAIGESRRQLYISETEKYAHVTYFINGGYPDPINGEKRELVKSSGHYSYSEHPEMKAEEITYRVLQYLKNKSYEFFCVNYANADMLGHTGNFSAAKKGIKFLDKEVKKLVDAVLKQNGTVFITADHGNAEEMIDTETGETLTEHTTNPVPFIVIGNGLRSMKLRSKGTLIDVAPTLLSFMKIQKPSEMTGKSLIQEIRN